MAKQEEFRLRVKNQDTHWEAGANWEKLPHYIPALTPKIQAEGQENFHSND